MRELFALNKLARKRDMQFADLARLRQWGNSLSILVAKYSAQSRALRKPIGNQNTTMSEQNENSELAIIQSETSAKDAIHAALGISKDALRDNGSLTSFPLFAETQNVELDKASADYNRDAVKALRAQFDALRVEYFSKVKPVAAGLLAQDGFNVRSLQPKFNAKTGEYQGVNIQVRRVTKSAALSTRAENVMLKKQIAELRAQMAQLPASA